LEKFIRDEMLKSKEPPTEKVISKCFDPLKSMFKVADQIKALQTRYPKIIKSFDISKRGEIEVIYWKLEQQDDAIPDPQNPGWDFVRNEVEGIIPYSVALHLNKEDLAEGRDIEDKVVS
jgi:hypothetical protein